jgi:chorismate lyase/3-hydroxybenzoate synthase
MRVVLDFSRTRGDEMTQPDSAGSNTLIHDAQNVAPQTLPNLHVCYEQQLSLDALLADANVLAVIGFGDGAAATHADPRYLHVALQPLDGKAPFEVWRTPNAVTAQSPGAVRWAGDGDYAFGCIEMDEAQHGGIENAAEAAYRALAGWLATSATPHVLRIWNYLDAINLGHGDAERYRRFCSGRAVGMRHGFADGYPAATAIGVRDGRRVLQTYWLAARSKGAALENPRQVSAWRYPREYGPDAPGFARAMRAPTKTAQVYISGTAAIIGHSSHHRDDFVAQIDETLANVDSVLSAAEIPAAQRFGARCVLKAYVRRDADAQAARALLQARLPESTSLLMLRGDVCRGELLVEIDGVQGA